MPFTALHHTLLIDKNIDTALLQDQSCRLRHCNGAFYLHYNGQSYRYRTSHAVYGIATVSDALRYTP